MKENSTIIVINTPIVCAAIALPYTCKKTCTHCMTMFPKTNQYLLFICSHIAMHFQHLAQT